MKKILSAIFFLSALGLQMSSCAHPMVEATEHTLSTYSRSYNIDANQIYEAIRWALKTDGYAIAAEDLQNGLISSGWKSSTADSHYIEPFSGHRDFGVNGAYYKLDLKITPEGSATSRVEIASRVKSVVSHLKSSGIEEEKLLKRIGDYVRRPEIRVTNLGVEE